MTNKTSPSDHHSTGSGTWLTDHVGKLVVNLQERRRQAAARRVLASLDDRQRRDAGVGGGHESLSKEAAARVVCVANLSSLR